jgi:hypothetical protein
MSRKGLGVATVQDGDGRLLGVITDGDLRRLMEKDPTPLARSASEVMHPGGVAIGAGELASAALGVLEERRITSLMVCARRLEKCSTSTTCGGLVSSDLQFVVQSRGRGIGSGADPGAGGGRRGHGARSH